MKHIKTIEIIKDYRTLKTGLRIELKSLNIIVGEQGSGYNFLTEMLS
jgi:predicted ATPase